MKHNKKTAFTAALLTASISLSACNGGNSEYQTEYGPPDIYEPSTEEIQDVYGPPPVVEEDSMLETTQIKVIPNETSTESLTTETQSSSKAIDMQLVYGPPNAID